MIFPGWFEIGLNIAELSLPLVVLVSFVIYLRRRSMRPVEQGRALDGGGVRLAQHG
jgi:hypothetical protein